MSHFPPRKQLYVCENSINNLIVSELGYHDFNFIEGVKTQRVQQGHTLHFIINGKGTLYINNNTFSLAQNDFFYVAPNTLFSYYPDDEKPWKYIWFLVYGDSAFELFSQAGFSQHNPVYKSKNHNDILITYENLFLSCQNAKSSVFFYTVSALYKVLALISDERNFQAPQSKNLQDYHMQKIYEYISVNYSNPNFSINLLAKMIPISHSYLCRVFKNKTNTSAKNYLIKYRLKKASVLLKETNLSVKEIAFSVGYSDETHFSKEFKKNYNVTATNYRGLNA